MSPFDMCPFRVCVYNSSDVVITSTNDDLRTGLLDNDFGDAYETGSIESCGHDHATHVETVGELGEFEKPSYFVFPPSWPDSARYWSAQAVIWIPTAMAIPAIILWALESFTNYRG